MLKLKFMFMIMMIMIIIIIIHSFNFNVTHIVLKVWTFIKSETSFREDLLALSLT